MATRVKADITERWWKQTWPVEKQQPPKFNEVTKAIKAYKVAKRGLSQSDLLDRLDDLRKALGQSEKSAKTQLKNLDKKTQDLFFDDLAAVDKIISAQLTDAVRVGNKTEVVYERDVGRYLTDQFSGTQDLRIQIKSTKVQFELLVAVVNEIKAKGGDAFLLRAYNDLVDTYVENIEKRIRKDHRANADKYFTGKADQSKAIKKIIDEELKALYDKSPEVPTKTLRKVGIYGEIEKTYAARIAKKVGKAAVSGAVTASAAGGIVLVGTPPLAIVGCVMAATAAARDCADVLMPLQTKAKVLNKTLASVVKTMNKKLAEAMAREGAFAFGNEALGIDVFPTLKKARADFKDIEKGLNILMHRNVVRQKKLGEAIDLLSKLEKELKDGVPGVTQKDVQKAAKPVNEMATGAISMMGKGMRIEKHYMKQKDTLDGLIKLEGKVKGIQNKADWFGFFKDLGMGIGGVADAATYTEVGKLITDAERAQAVGNASAALLTEIAKKLKAAAKG